MADMIERYYIIKRYWGLFNKKYCFYFSGIDGLL